MELFYERQRDLNIKSMKHVVVGAGGIGAWVSILSAMAGDEVIVFDDDVLEIHNLNRLPFTKEDVGKPKVEVLKKFIERMDRKITVFNKRVEFPEEILILSPDYVTIAVDRMGIAEKIAERLLNEGVPFACVNYDGHHVTLRFNESPAGEFDIDPNDTGYTIFPSWVAPPVFIAAVVVEVMHTRPKTKRTLSFELDKFMEVVT